MTNSILSSEVIKAFNFSEERTRGQTRNFGKSKKGDKIEYFVHVKNVARIVEYIISEYGTEEERKNIIKYVIGGLLHDIVEDKKATIQEIRDFFGEEMATIVQNLSNNKEEITKISKKEYMKNKVLRFVELDLLIELIVKLADRFHNIHYLHYDKAEIGFIKRYYEETKYAFVDNLKDKIQFCSVATQKLYEMICADMKILQILYNL